MPDKTALKRLILLISVLVPGACTQLDTDKAPVTTLASQLDAGLPDPLAAGWNGRAVCEQLAQNPKQRVLRCTFPPGVGHERHYHVSHFGYALSGGRMQLTDSRGVRVVDLATGSHYSSDGTEWHEVLNVGDTTVQYLIIEPL